MSVNQTIYDENNEAMLDEDGNKLTEKVRKKFKIHKKC